MFSCDREIRLLKFDAGRLMAVKEDSFVQDKKAHDKSRNPSLIRNQKNHWETAAKPLPEPLKRRSELSLHEKREIVGKNYKAPVIVAGAFAL